LLGSKVDQDQAGFFHFPKHMILCIISKIDEEEFGHLKLEDNLV
jgi:hypothetical protein